MLEGTGEPGRKANGEESEAADGLRLDRTGRRHLLILDADATRPETGFANVETWRLGQTHASLEWLASSLIGRLAQASVGLRLYLKGGQPLILALSAVAKTAGMLSEEIREELIEGPEQRIVCVSCRRIRLVPAASTQAICSCGLHLSIRRQVSPRLGAKLAVPFLG